MLYLWEAMKDHSIARLRGSHFLESRLTEGGDSVSLTHRSPFNPQGKDSLYLFLLEAESTEGP
jgi:hypothetical protein